MLSELGLARLPRRRAALASATTPCSRRSVRGVPASVEEIAGRSALPVPELLARLSVLELSGRLRRLPGAFFVRS